MYICSSYITFVKYDTVVVHGVCMQSQTHTHREKEQCPKNEYIAICLLTEEAR